MYDDRIALMVLRHHLVPTRLLDWTQKPEVAAFFAADDCSQSNGEIWCFDERVYEVVGKEQWKMYPETTRHGDGNPDEFDPLPAFSREEPGPWWICAFYKEGFPRQLAQGGAYTMTARFGVRHEDAIADLLKNPALFDRYTIPSELKPTLLKAVGEKHNISRGSLYPDSSGAAETVLREVFRLERAVTERGTT